MPISVFYEPCVGHELPHNPFNAIVVPRPIGWISTLDENGCVNLAPFSFFNAVAYVPPQVMFATTGPHAQDGAHKDSMRNALATREFVVNLATWELREAGPAPVHLECRVTTHVELPTPDPDDPDTVVFGEVVGVHIADEVIVDGLVDVTRLDPIARLGYREYVHVRDRFTMTRPGWPIADC